LQYVTCIVCFGRDIHYNAIQHFRFSCTNVSRGHNYPGAESLRGHRITAGDAGKSQQCHKYFLQYSAFASERPQVRTWDAKLASCPGAIYNLVTPLHAEPYYLLYEAREAHKNALISLTDCKS